MKDFASNSENETVDFGERLGKMLRRKDVIALCGGLGSGKTVFIKGIARGLGVESSEYVNSPSFVIIKEYRGRLPLYHFDIYRLNNVSQFLTVDYAEYFYGEGVSVVEWADKIIQLLPKDFLRIDIHVTGEKERKIHIAPYGRRYEDLVKKLQI